MAKEFIYDEVEYSSKASLKEYNDLLGKYEFDVSVMSKHYGYEKTESFFQNYIKKHPRFIQPYEELCRFYYQNGKLIELQAYHSLGYMASVSILKEETGNFPDVLEWGWMENRPLIRFLSQGAEDLWKKYAMQQALELYEYLLSSNVSDNIGARYHLLALYLGMTHEEFEMGHIAVNGDYGRDIDQWFNKGYKKYKPLVAWVKKSKELFG